MKKLFSMLMLGLILVLLLFSGCSEKAEMPYNANNERINTLDMNGLSAFQKEDLKIFQICKIDGNSYIVIGELFEDPNGNIEIIFPKCNEIDIFSYEILNPHLKHFLEDIKHFFIVGYFSEVLKNPQTSNAFIGKINATINMIDTGNYQGAIKKLQNDIIPFGDRFIDDWLRKNYFKQLCLITIEMLQDPESPYFYSIGGASFGKHLFYKLVYYAAKLGITHIECEDCKFNCAKYTNTEDGYNDCINDVCFCEGCPCTKFW